MGKKVKIKKGSNIGIKEVTYSKVVKQVEEKIKEDDIKDKEEPPVKLEKINEKNFENSDDNGKLNETIKNKLIDSARKYKSKLVGKKFLIVGKSNKDAKIKCYELFFRTANFKHLTGVEIKNKNDRFVSANEFFKRCVNGDIETKDLVLQSNYVLTKLLQLDEMIDLVTKGKRIAERKEDNNSKVQFKIIIKGIKTGLLVAFGEEKDSSRNEGLYPCSLLNQKNIKTLGKKVMVIDAIYSKKEFEEVYKKPVYIRCGSHISARKIERATNYKVARGGVYKVAGNSEMARRIVQDRSAEKAFDELVRPTLPKPKYKPEYQPKRKNSKPRVWSF